MAERADRIGALAPAAGAVMSWTVAARLSLEQEAGVGARAGKLTLPAAAVAAERTMESLVKAAMASAPAIQVAAAAQRVAMAVVAEEQGMPVRAQAADPTTAVKEETTKHLAPTAMEQVVRAAIPGVAVVAVLLRLPAWSRTQRTSSLQLLTLP